MDKFLDLTKDYVLPAAATLFSLLFLLYVKSVLWNRSFVWCNANRPHWDKTGLAAFRLPLNFLALVFSLSLGLQLAPHEVATHPVLLMGLKALFVVAGFWLLQRSLTVGFRLTAHQSSLAPATRSLLLKLCQMTLLLITAPILLDTFGISITPVLASLGVGSIAVALAAQDTLSNFFSGIYMLIDQPVRAGDYIRLEGNQEGTVRRIGWRSTRLEGSSNNIVVIPNSKLSSSVLVNFSMPDPETGFTVSLVTGYEVSLNRVEEVTLEVARDVVSRSGSAVASFGPVVRFTSLIDGVQFQVGFRSKTFSDRAVLRHEFLKAIDERFKKEGIRFLNRAVLANAVTGD